MVYVPGDGYGPGNPCENGWQCQGGCVGCGDKTECPWPYELREATYYEKICWPDIPATPGQPYIPGSPAQISRNYNEGWRNSSSRSAHPLNPGQMLRFRCAPGIRGAFVGLGRPGMDLRQIADFRWGLMVTTDGVRVWENGASVATIKRLHLASDYLVISRRQNGVVRYSVDSSEPSTVHYSAHDCSPMDALHVYAILYRGGDSLLYAAIMDELPAQELEISMLQQAEYFAGSANARMVQQAVYTAGMPFVAEMIQAVRQRVEHNRNRAVMQAVMSSPTAMIGEGSPPSYMTATMNPPAMEANDDYVPPPLQGVMAMVHPPLSSLMVSAVCFGDMNATVHPVMSLMHDGEGLMASIMPDLQFRGGEDPYPNAMAMMEVLDLTGFVRAFRSASVYMVSAMDMESSAAFSRQLTMELMSTMHMAGTLQMLAEVLMVLMSEMIADGIMSMSIGDQPDMPNSSTWTMNLETSGVTVYRDYGFNSFMTSSEGEVYGVTNDGIFKLDGVGVEPHEAYIDFGQLRFSDHDRTRVPYWYISAAASGKLILRLDVDGRKFYYEARTSSPEVRNHRVDTGKGLAGMMWKAIVVSRARTNLAELESLHFEAIPAARRI